MKVDSRVIPVNVGAGDSSQMGGLIVTFFSEWQGLRDNLKPLGATTGHLFFSFGQRIV